MRLIDVRDAAELTGPLGHIPGSDWVPLNELLADVDVVAGRVHRDDPVVIVARTDERSKTAAERLVARGLRMVAALEGGVLAWRAQGFATTRDLRITHRKGEIRSIPAYVDDDATRHLTIDEVQAHVGDPFAVRHMKFAALLLHGRLSCVDGRDDSGVVGTPGGDTGEFLLALSALERVTGKALGDVEVGKLLRRRLDTFGRFYLHTDIHAGNALISRLRNDRRFDGPLQNVFHTHEWRRFLRNPPKELRPLLLDILMENPHHLGCGHVRLSLQNADEYGSRALLIESFLRLFFNTLWQGDVSADYVALGGGHREGAVVNVVVDDDVHSFTDIPLVSPSLGGQQMFVNHPQVASFLRRELAAFLVQQRDIVSLPPGGEAALIAEIDALAARQLTSTLSRLAKGLPIYTATFGKEAVRVDDNGFV